MSFGVGPYVRFDHQSGPLGYYLGGIGVGSSAGLNSIGTSLGVALPFDDFPRLSVTAGGYAGTGFDVRLGEKKDMAVTVDGRYTIARVTDFLGNPGDFSGFALLLGIGKYF